MQNYHLRNNFASLSKILDRQATERAQNLPNNSSQKINLDVKNRGYSTEFSENKTARLYETLP